MRIPAGENDDTSLNIRRIFVEEQVADVRGGPDFFLIHNLRHVVDHD